MPRAPRVTGAEAVAALKQDDWTVKRIAGSHYHLEHETKPGIVTVPVHAGVILAPKTLASIVRSAGLTMDQFRRLL